MMVLRLSAEAEQLLSNSNLLLIRNEQLFVLSFASPGGTADARDGATLESFFVVSFILFDFRVLSF